MYKLISGLYPNFRGTILISGEKSKYWFPTDNSIDNFKRYYSHIYKKYDLDDELDDTLIKKMQLEV